MPVVGLSTAIAAYTNAAKAPGQPGLAARPGPHASFGEALRQVGTDAVEVLRQSERQSLAAAAGKADIADVVTAVANAEVTLQTVVAVRDRVIQAYQDILRMPI